MKMKSSFSLPFSETRSTLYPLIIQAAEIVCTGFFGSIIAIKKYIYECGTHSETFGFLLGTLRPM